MYYQIWYESNDCTTVKKKAESYIPNGYIDGSCIKYGEQFAKIYCGEE